MEESGNAEERVTESDSARKGRIDLTQFEGNTEGPWIMGELGEIWRAVAPNAEPFCVMSFYHHPSIKPSEADLRLMAAGPVLIAELKKCYEIINIYQSTGEDFSTQLAFHEKGLCEYLKHPCGPCEGEEGYYDDPLELSPELQAFYERGPSPRRTTEKQMEEAQRKSEYGHSRPSVDDYNPVYDDPNYDEGPWE